VRLFSNRSRIAWLAVSIVMVPLCVYLATAHGQPAEAGPSDLKGKPIAPHRAKWPELQTIHRQGTAEMLQQIKPDEIAKIQILRFEHLPSGEIERKYAGRPMEKGPEDTPEIGGLCALVAQADKYVRPPGLRRILGGPDYVLVVHPVTGAPFEIPYSSHLDEPFGGVHSRPLKEALYALAGGTIKVTIIQFDQGAVQEVFHTQAIAPHGGGVYSARTSVEMRLNADDGLTLYVKVREKKTTLMEDNQPLRFGDAEVYKRTQAGRGHYIVLLGRLW
jgi:hypothetical protein